MNPPASAGDNVLLELEQVCAGYARRQVLTDVSLTVRRGRVLALVGSNGTGKTTLLRVLLGLIAPRGGRVLGSRPRLGYVPQADASEVLFPVTSEEVVLMGLTPTLGLLRRPGPAQHERVRAALARFDVERLANRPFRALSGGQRQRVLLARAVAPEPQLLVLDEPVRGLDFASAETLVAALGRLAHQDGISVVVATHSLDLVANHADDVALFQDGHVRCGPAEQMFTDAELSRYHGVPVRVRTVEGRRVVLPGPQADQAKGARR